MPNLTASIPHQLGRTEARRRIQEQIGALRQQPGFSLAELRESWTGDRMDFSVQSAGQTIFGHLIVDDQMVHVNLALPWLLSLITGPFKKRIEQDVQRLLSAPAKSPEQSNR